MSFALILERSDSTTVGTGLIAGPRLAPAHMNDMGRLDV
jgi:hypothetical protein